MTVVSTQLGYLSCNLRVKNNPHVVVFDPKLQIAGLKQPPRFCSELINSKYVRTGMCVSVSMCMYAVYVAACKHSCMCVRISTKICIVQLLHYMNYMTQRLPL